MPEDTDYRIHGCDGCENVKLCRHLDRCELEPDPDQDERLDGSMARGMRSFTGGAR